MSNENKMLSDLVTLLPTFGDPVRIIELGMNDGTHTHSIVRTLLGARRNFVYIALEPDPRIHPFVPPGVTFVRAAVAAADGKTTLHLSGGVSEQGMRYTGSSSLYPPGELIHQYWPKMTFDSKAEVEGISYDTLCERYGLPEVDFVWCDIQGCEGDAVKGGSKFFPKTKWFFTEYADDRIYDGQATFAEVRDMLPEWVIHTDYGGDALLRNTAYDNAQ